MRKKVLLIDDSVTIHKIVDLTIDRQNFELLSAYDINEGLTASTSEVPALILIDNKLFTHTSEEAITELRVNNPSVGIVLLVGAYDHLENELEHTVVDDYIVKPFNSGTLNQVLSDILAKKGELIQKTQTPEAEVVDTEIVDTATVQKGAGEESQKHQEAAPAEIIEAEIQDASPTVIDTTSTASDTEKIKIESPVSVAEPALPSADELPDFSTDDLLKEAEELLALGDEPIDDISDKTLPVPEQDALSLQPPAENEMSPSELPDENQTEPESVNTLSAVQEPTAVENITPEIPEKISSQEEIMVTPEEQQPLLLPDTAEITEVQTADSSHEAASAGEMQADPDTEDTFGEETQAKPTVSESELSQEPVSTETDKALPLPEEVQTDKTLPAEEILPTEEPPTDDMPILSDDTEAPAMQAESAPDEITETLQETEPVEEIQDKPKTDMSEPSLPQETLSAEADIAEITEQSDELSLPEDDADAVDTPVEELILTTETIEDIPDEQLPVLETLEPLGDNEEILPDLDTLTGIPEEEMTEPVVPNENTHPMSEMLDIIDEAIETETDNKPIAMDQMDDLIDDMINNNINPLAPETPLDITAEDIKEPDEYTLNADQSFTEVENIMGPTEEPAAALSNEPETERRSLPETQEDKGIFIPAGENQLDVEEAFSPAEPDLFKEGFDMNTAASPTGDEREELSTLFNELNLSYDKDIKPDTPPVETPVREQPAEPDHLPDATLTDSEIVMKSPVIKTEESSVQTAQTNPARAESSSEPVAKLVIELSKQDLIKLLETSVNKDLLEKIMKEILQDSISEAVEKLVPNLAEKLVREELKIIKGE